jgi:hypothetical protein
MKNRFIVIIILTFVVLTGVFYLLKMSFPSFNFIVLMGGNAIMAALSLISYFIINKQLKGRPEAFVRGVYAATFLKLLVCMFSILTYVLLYREHLHKPTIFTLFGIYAVYTCVETWLLSKLAKEVK